MVSKEFTRIYKVLSGRKKVGYTPTLEEQRANLDLIAAMAKKDDDMQINQIDAGGCPAEWISTNDSTENRAVLYLHGGGYVAGGPHTHRGIATRLSRLIKGRTLLLDYRLAPENPFPAGLEDCINAYKWLINSEGIAPKNIIIAGDSSGGGLTIATQLKLKEENIPLPRITICISPWIDLTLTSNAFKNNAEIDPFLTPELLISASKWYYGENDPKDPFITTLYGALQGLPPILITVGTQELLYDDAVHLAERAKEAGVEVVLEIFKDMIHVFQAFIGFFPEAQEGMDKIGEFIKKYFE
ncbi:MAG: alpha/beta hydrolase [Promethearchaeota archaeon]